jgi:hypothetical protein
MWKLIVGFIAFAALALFILTKSGGNIDLSGEKHDVTGGHDAPAAASAPDAASAPASGALPLAVDPAASAASPVAQ